MNDRAAEATSTASAARHITTQCQFCQTWNRVDAARVGDRPKCGQCGRPLLLDRPVALSEDSFHRTISESDVPVLVDFYADWCGPCKIMAPLVDDLASRYQGQAMVGKVNTDRAQAIAESYGIRGIPTTIVFRGGKEVARDVGAVPAARLDALMRQGLDR